MGWFSKDEEVPEVSRAPFGSFSFGEEDDEMRNLPELPSFPKGLSGNSINQVVVKEAVNDDSPIEDGEDGVDSLGEIPVLGLMNNNSGRIPSRPREDEIKEEMGRIESPPKENVLLKESEPVFIRIDKFTASQKSFEQIKEKLKKIEGVLEKIKGAREKEEAEIESWTKDVESLKLKLSELDSGIFERL